MLCVFGPGKAMAKPSRWRHGFDTRLVRLGGNLDRYGSYLIV